jgi:thioredoxin 1
MAGANTKTFTDDNFKSDVLDSSTPVLVDFWAEWCGPCRVLGPVIDQLADEYDGRIAVGKMNVDDSPTTPGSFGIRGIPTLLVFKDGEVVGQLVGAQPKARISEQLDRALEA